MKRRQKYTWLGLTLWPVLALGQTSALNGIEALLSVGRASNSPIGIVCDASKTLERASISYHNGMKIKDVVAQLPLYSAVERQGVIVVAPRTIPKATARTLDTIIESYTTGPATFAQMGAALWMNLRVATSEQKPNTFIGVVSGHDPAVVGKGISLHDASVETILNAIVRSSSGAAWIVLPPLKPAEEAEPGDLWNFVHYRTGDAAGPIRSLCCVSWDLLSP